jgi:hypothetical protein
MVNLSWALKKTHRNKQTNKQEVSISIHKLPRQSPIQYDSYSYKATRLYTVLDRVARTGQAYFYNR